MPKIRYKDIKFRSEEKLRMIGQAQAICEEYEAQGLDLTLRQLYYQFVARGLIPNNLKSYNRLGKTLNDARLAGYIDWDHLVDRTRNLSGVRHFLNPLDMVKKGFKEYAIDKWATQDVRVEVWVEKEALAGVVEQACAPLDVDFFSCRGFVSQSEMWRAGQRLLRHVMEYNRRVVILHLGDHDPSGMDMSRDIEDRLRMFVGGKLATEGLIKYRDEYEEHVELRRIALTIDQVHELDPPPNPAKLTDSRAKKYVEEFGYESWELDALDPAYVLRLITKHVLRERDEALWEQSVAQEAEDRRKLQSVIANWQ